MPLIYLQHADPNTDLWKSDLYFRHTVFNVYGPLILIFVAHAIYYLTCASIKAVVYELQLPYKSHFCRKLNDMKKTLVLQTPHMEKSRSGWLHVQRKFITTVVFYQVIWKLQSKRIITTCKLKEHQRYTNVQNFYIQNLTCIKHASHEFIHHSYVKI